jgi:His-Xaa-Ser system protein HxsD
MYEASGSECVFTTVRDGVVFISIDEQLYSREAVLRTCYWFTDRAYLYVTRPRAGFFEVQLKLKQNRPTLAEPELARLEDIAGEFLNQLLDYQLRQDIEAQTGAVRELLVAKAFAETGVLEDLPPGDAADSVEVKKQALVQLTAKGN